MKKKIVMSLILCVVFIGLLLFFGTNSFHAKATEREITASGTTGDVNWTFYTDGELHIHGEGAMADYSSYSAQPWNKYRNEISTITVSEGVTAVGKRCFCATDVKYAKIASSVTTIGSVAFNGCTYLENIDISYGVKTIESSAFTGCKNLEKIIMPNSITKIGMYCFEDCESMEILVISDNLSSLNTDIFSNCKALKNVTIGKNINSISLNVFYNCTNIENVYYNGTLRSWCNISFAKNANPLAYADNFFINGELVPSNLLIPNSCTWIKPYAFYGASFIESVVMPSSVTSIDEYAFSNCSELKSVTLSQKLEIIDHDAFKNCNSLETITIPEFVYEIRERVFDSCEKLTSINVDSKNKSYSSDSFGVLFDKNKTRIIQYPSGNMNAEYVVPDTVEVINKYAFYGSKYLTKITLPSNVKRIEEYAFAESKLLSEISVTDSVEYIGKFAFKNNGYFNDKANWDNGFLYLETLLIGADKNNVATECSLYSKTTLVASGVFEGFNISHIHLNKNLKYINDSAFKQCTKLTSLTFPKNLLIIGKEAFSNCGAIETVTLNYGLTEIHSKVFAYSRKFKELKIPQTVTFLAFDSFDSSGITDIYYDNTKSDWKRLANGENFEGITVHYTLRSNDESVIINHTDENFNWEAGNVHLKIEELNSVTSKYHQNGFYTKLMTDPLQILDIKLVDGDGNSIQPLSDEKITVKIKADESFLNLLKSGLSAVSEYDIDAASINFFDDCFVFETNKKTVSVPASESFLKSFSIIHWYSDAVSLKDFESFTHDEISVENGYITLETNHFSEYAVCTDLLSFEKKEITLNVGDSAQLNIITSNASELVFTSSDENVAIVSDDGIVTAVGSGNATITVKKDGIDISDTCAITVAAREFTVKWIVDGVVNEQTVSEKEKLTQPDSPEKDGYTFIDWIPEVPENMPAKNVEFTATWQINQYTITFDTNGGNTIAPINLDYGSVITAPENPVREGYVFKGWVPSIPETMPSNDITVVAEYEKTEIPETPKVTVTEIRIVSTPIKTKYIYKTENLDLNGIAIQVICSDGTKEVISDTNVIKAYGFSNNSIGTKIVSVEYGGCTAKFEVTVSYTWWQWIIQILLLGFLWY